MMMTLSLAQEQSIDLLVQSDVMGDGWLCDGDRLVMCVELQLVD